jgi:molybdopterin synthase sulfur carrier subunit
MSINVRYFASLREMLAKSEDFLEIKQGITVAEVWEKVNPNKAMPDNTLIAVNMEYVSLIENVNEGDEVAFFPPVTGG